MSHKGVGRVWRKMGGRGGSWDGEKGGSEGSGGFNSIRDQDLPNIARTQHVNRRFNTSEAVIF